MTSASVSSVNARRRRRIERELLALRTMQQNLRTSDIACAVLAIPALSLLCLSVAFKLHWVFGSGVVAFTGALAFGTFIWWIGRRWFLLSLYVVMALIAIRCGIFPDPSFPIGEPNLKQPRQAKVELAIAKREAILQSLNAP